MSGLLEEVIRSIELWLRLVKKQQPYVNPDLDPVLLVPGIAGSILNAVTEDGQEDRVWVRLLNADFEFCTKLWSQFDPSTGETWLNFHHFINGIGISCNLFFTCFSFAIMIKLLNFPVSRVGFHV